MIYINYGTDEHFDENIGDKYFCKSRRSAKKHLKELLQIQDYSKATIEQVLHEFDKASVYVTFKAQIEIKDIICIDIYEVDLI